MSTGTVSRIASKDINTKFGAKKKYSMEIDGTWYDAGWKKPTVVEGTVVSFDYKETSYGKELTSYSPSTGGAGGTTATPAAKVNNAFSGGFRGSSFPVPPLDPSRSIIRQNALRHATALVTHTKANELGNELDLATIIIQVARVFEEYVSGDTEVAAAKAEIAEQKE